MLELLADSGWLILLLLVGAGFIAGLMDALVGGGGLLQLPVMLLLPGITPVQALASNKLASIFGTTTSAISYALSIPPRWAQVLPMAAAAAVTSYLGAVSAAGLPEAVLKPIIIGALAVVLLITVLKPELGSHTRPAPHSAGRVLLGVLLLGLGIGFYDGLIGPGTGAFLIMGLVLVVGESFLQASATAKIVNWATNAGALAFFIPLGAVRWEFALAAGIPNVFGALLGTKLALRRGSAFIRLALLVIVSVLLVSLIVQLLGQNG